MEVARQNQLIVFADEIYDKTLYDGETHTSIASLADDVLLDYSSLSGHPAAQTKADDIIADWSDFLPKFKFTLHLISNLEINLQGGTATVFCKGEAVHHLPNAEGGDVWKVYGTYDIELTKLGELWKVISLKFNQLYQEGNVNLPVIATAQK